MDNEIINKVSQSGLVTFDLSLLKPQGERIAFDIKPLLFHELILKEKEFREFIKSHDWSAYTHKYVAVHCSNDAIVPTWAFMLIALALEPYAHRVVFGSIEDLEKEIFSQVLNAIDYSQYNDARVVIKGCGDPSIPMNAYITITSELKKHVKSMMYGEPCSTVPLYKAPKTNL